MMKIGVFGGTFNPIHNSHVYIAEEFGEKLLLDKIWLIPTYTPPHKSSKGLVEPDHRLEMCRMAVRGLPRFTVSEYEIQMQGKSYTYKTLAHIGKAHPDAEIYLIMGSDMFLSVQEWKNPREIYRMAILCVAQREFDGLDLIGVHKKVLEKQGAKCRLLDIEARPLSSTMIRDMIHLGEDPAAMLHPDVWEYIQKHKLYRER